MASVITKNRYPALMISAGQIRAARQLLGWRQADLASQSGVSEISIKNIERGATDARGSTLQKIQNALSEGGVAFIERGQYEGDGGPGVRLRR